MLPHVFQLQLEFVPHVTVHVRQLLRQMHIYFWVSGRNRQTLPQHMQSRLRRCSVSHLKRTYRVLHEYMIEERQKTQRNEIARTFIANQCSHSQHHATLLGNVGIKKTPNARANTQRKFRWYNGNRFYRNPKQTNINDNEANLTTDTHESAQNCWNIIKEKQRRRVEHMHNKPIL